MKTGPCGPFSLLVLVRMRTGAFARRRRSTAEPWMAERTSRAQRAMARRASARKARVIPPPRPMTKAALVARFLLAEECRWASPDRVRDQPNLEYSSFLRRPESIFVGRQSKQVG